MSTAACPSCHRPAKLRFRARDWNRQLGDELFAYHKCEQCRLIFIDSIPTDLAQSYPASYYPVPSSRDELARRSANESYKLETVQEHIRSGKLLEIGGSFGAFAFLAKSAGFEVDVLEMDERCCAFLRDVAGVRAFNEADPVAGLERQGHYNVIALWQVIEHLPDPWSLLEVAVDHLSPGGFLVIAAPNPDSFQFKIQGARWPHLDAPRHLSLIPIPLLSARLQARGLHCSSARTDDAGSLHWNRFGWHMWAATWGNSDRTKRLMQKLGRAAGLIAAPIERHGLRGSTYTLVFQKPVANH